MEKQKSQEIHDPHGLNPKQRAFVENYLKGMPAGRAYEAAGYSAKGRSADAQAAKLVTNGNVSQAIQEGRGEMRNAARKDKEQVLDELFAIWGSRPSEASMDNPLCEVRHTAFGPMPVFPDKAKVLERIAKMLKWDEPEQHVCEMTVVIGGKSSE